MRNVLRPVVHQDILLWDEDQHAVGSDGVDHRVRHAAVVGLGVFVSEEQTLEQLCGLPLGMLG